MVLGANKSLVLWGFYFLPHMLHAGVFKARKFHGIGNDIPEKMIGKSTGKFPELGSFFFFFHLLLLLLSLRIVKVRVQWLSSSEIEA